MLRKDSQCGHARTMHRPLCLHQVHKGHCTRLQCIKSIVNIGGYDFSLTPKGRLLYTKKDQTTMICQHGNHHNTTKDTIQRT